MSTPNPLLSQLTPFPFIYSSPATVIAAGAAAVPVQITVDNDADFQALAALAGGWANAAPQTPIDPKSLPFLFDWKTSSASQGLNNNPMLFEEFFGTAEFPGAIPGDPVFSKKTTITFTLSNNDPANAYTVIISLMGLKLLSAAPG